MSKGKYNEDIEIDLDKCATTDSTGLIPALPITSAERQSYKSISHYEAEAKKVKNRQDIEIK